MITEWGFEIVLLVLGGVGGFLSGLTSTGPGLLIVPLLTVAYRAAGVPTSVALQLAFATSLLSVIVIFFISTAVHFKLGHFNNTQTLLLFLGSIPGALVGTQLGYFSYGKVILILVGVAAMVSGASLILHGDSQRHLYSDDDDRFSGPLTFGQKLDLFAIGILTGSASSILGVGGGIVAVPLQTISGIPVYRAIHNTCLISLATYLIGIFQYTVIQNFSTSAFHLIGPINIFDSVLLSAGGFIGSYLGVHAGAILLRKRIYTIVGEIYVFLGSLLIVQQVFLG